jgi:WD40 repeat protein
MRKIIVVAIVGCALAVCLPLGAAVVWPPVATFQGHSGVEPYLVLSPDGKTLASVSNADKTVRLWDVATRKKRATLRRQAGDVTCLAFSPDGTTVATPAPASATIKLWEVDTGEERLSFSGHAGDVSSLAFSPDGNTLASGSRDNSVKLWDVAAGKERTTLRGHTNSIVAVAFSPDGTTVASASDDHTVKLWDASTGKMRTTLEGHPFWLSGVAFSPDGKTLLTWNNTNGPTIKRWDVASGKELVFERPDWLIQLSGNDVVSVAFSPDSSTLAICTYENMIGTWDVSSGKNTAVFGENHRPLQPPMNRVLSSLGMSAKTKLCEVRFTSDGKLMAFGTDDKTVKTWSVTTISK